MYKCYLLWTNSGYKYFLDLPRQLFGKNTYQDMKIERDILDGKHILSKDFKVYPLLVMKNDAAVARAIMTIYENDDNAYLGFFESTKDLSAVKCLIEGAAKKAKELNKKSIIGPIDASIFINYRFKLNNFDKPFTSEPINQSYYPELWEQCGFKLKDAYVSNKIRKMNENDFDERYKKIYDRYVDRGFKFISPTKHTFETNMKDVYNLLMELYADFPGYKKISEAQFMDMFSSLKYVADYKAIRLVYKNDELYAFCVSVPNYKDLTAGNLTFMKLIKILLIKMHPKEYVTLYLGASKKAAGMGCALMHDVRNFMFKKQSTAIGALIHTGKITEKMYENLYIDQTRYGLYQLDI